MDLIHYSQQKNLRWLVDSVLAPHIEHMSLILKAAAILQILSVGILLASRILLNG